MKIALATLCLNEMQWLPRLYEQHEEWPNLHRWIFVEAADVVYRNANPSMVSEGGLSVDGTTTFLQEMVTDDSRLAHIQLGTVSGNHPDQNKCLARNAYLDALRDDPPDWLIVLDADEFYTHEDQWGIIKLLEKWQQSTITGHVLRQRHIWQPPSLNQRYPLFHAEVTGGYWNIPHCRIWKWYDGIAYRRDHNTPGSGLRMQRHDGDKTAPECVHMGFASKGTDRVAKHKYYITRGEGRADGRQLSVDCRAAWESWQPGDILPHRAQVLAYYGSVPQVLKEQLR